MRESPTITLTRSTRDGAVDAEFVVPRQLGSVRLQREIGRGGMGVVWLGQDELLSRGYLAGASVADIEAEWPTGVDEQLAERLVLFAVTEKRTRAEMDAFATEVASL